VRAGWDRDFEIRWQPLIALITRHCPHPLTTNIHAKGAHIITVHVIVKAEALAAFKREWPRLHFSFAALCSASCISVHVIPCRNKIERFTKHDATWKRTARALTNSCENDRWRPQRHEEDVKTSEMASWTWRREVVTVVTQWPDVIYSSSNVAFSRRVVFAKTL